MKKLIPIVVFLFLAGASNGLMDALHFHKAWQNFENAQYWNPNVSWENKWALDSEGNTIIGKERFLGSSTVFVSLTDGWHLAKFLFLLFFTLAVVAALNICEGKDDFYMPLGYWVGVIWVIYFVAAKICFSLGFHLVYSVIF